MKIQLEQLDLLAPWPTFTLREGYHAVAVLVRIGKTPLGVVQSRAVRRRLITPRRLQRRIARKLGWQLLALLAREALSAGPEALARLPVETRQALRDVSFGTASWRVQTRLLAKHMLLPGGLPPPWPQLLAEARNNAPSYPLPPVTIVVCTRDRADQLADCIDHLLKLDYPRFELLIVDNSANPAACRAVCQAREVTCIHEPQPGLSRARNTALAAVTTRWVAFTDDDCRPEPNWLRELVRKLQDTNCRCVTGLVLPAQLENSAEIAFEIYGGLGRGFVDVAYPHTFLRDDRFHPAETWDIGAGANMLLDADLARRLGGYDLDLGAGSACPCSEDTLLWYQILRSGHSIHYTPRAIVHHYHRSSPEALRRQIYGYAVGHAAYHVRCFFNYGDYRSALQLVWHLPRWFWRNYRRAVRGKTKYPRSLIPLEARGTLHGAFLYPWAKLRRLLGGNRQAPLSGTNPASPPAVIPMTQPDTDRIAYESSVGEKPVRAA